MSDMAKELGVSVTTISRALSNHHSIGPATKRLVKELAEKVNYQPNTLAAALRKGKSQLLGVIVPYIEGKFFPSVVHSVERAASQAGYSVIICQSHEDMAIERQNIETLLSAQVAGILVSMARTTTDLSHFDKVKSRNIPLVYFDRVPEGEDTNSVVLDDCAGGYESTINLIKQGYKRIAHFAGLQHLRIYKERRLGYLAALEAYGLPQEEDLISYTDMTVEEGALAMERLLKLSTPPDAVFSSSDFCVLGALQYLKKIGKRVPQDVALSGFSNESFTIITEPELSTVDQRCNEMGSEAVKLFLELLGSVQPTIPRRVVLQPQLFIRASSQRVDGFF
jgi:LacI family transcriptional regulator